MELKQESEYVHVRITLVLSNGFGRKYITKTPIATETNSHICTYARIKAQMRKR